LTGKCNEVGRVGFQVGSEQCPHLCREQEKRKGFAISPRQDHQQKRCYRGRRAEEKGKKKERRPILNRERVPSTWACSKYPLREKGGGGIPGSKRAKRQKNRGGKLALGA